MYLKRGVPIPWNLTRGHGVVGGLLLRVSSLSDQIIRRTLARSYKTTSRHIKERDSSPVTIAVFTCYIATAGIPLSPSAKRKVFRAPHGNNNAYHFHQNEEYPCRLAPPS